MTRDQWLEMRRGYQPWMDLSPEERREILQRNAEYMNRSHGCIDNPLPGRWYTKEEIKGMRKEKAS